MAEQDILGDLYRGLGFRITLDVTGRGNIRGLLAPADRRGLYGFDLADGTCYTGLSKDISKRLLAHLAYGKEVRRIFIKPIPMGSLIDAEREAIFAVEDFAMLHEGIRPINIVDAVESPYGVKLAALVDPQDMDAWLADPSQIVDRLARTDDPTHRVRYRQRFDQFTTEPLSGDITRCLQQYFTRCVPFPARTERAFWSLSCAPSTNRSSSPRLGVVNVNTMEVLVLGHQYGEPTRFWGFVNISASPTKAATKHDLKILNRLLDKVDAEVYEPSYHAPAGDCLAIHIAGNATNLISVLSNPTVQYAARVLNSRLMRKGPVGLFSKYHCYDLADQAIGP